MIKSRRKEWKHCHVSKKCRICSFTVFQMKLTCHKILESKKVFINIPETTKQFYFEFQTYSARYMTRVNEICQRIIYFPFSLEICNIFNI